MKKSLLERLEGRVFLSAAPASSVGTIQWHGQSVPAVLGEYLVQTRNGEDFSALAGKLKLPVSNVRSLDYANLWAFHSTVDSARVGTWSTRYSSTISLLAPNTVISTMATQPTDPRFAEQWHHLNTGQEITSTSYGPQVGTPGVDIDSEQAWDIVNSDSETDPKKQVVIATLDTGMDLAHSDLADNLFVNVDEIAGNGIDDDANGYIDDVNGWDTFHNSSSTQDDISEGHGTHVAGLIGAVGNNNVGVTGMVWRVKVMPVKVFSADGATTDEMVIQGMRYISRMKEQGYNIVAVNASLGGTTFPYSQIEAQAVQQLGERNILFIAAAGNDSLDVDRNPLFPAKYALNLPNVITVAATDNQDNLAAFSNFGAASVDVAAPGVGILSTFVGDTYSTLDGTSMAAPIVTGIIALEKLANPNATPAQLKSALLQGVEVLPSLSAVNGLPPRVRTSGRVNAFRSVNAIRNQFRFTDATHKGTWQGAYGAQGAYIVGESNSFPAFVNASFSGESTQVELAATTRRAEALQRAGNPDDRLLAYLATPSLLDINLEFTDGQAHRVGLYVADYDHKGREQYVSITDANTGQVMDTQKVTKFSGGKYLFWDVRGSVKIQLAPGKGGTAVFSGIFFDAPTTNDLLYVSKNTSARGNWDTKFGSSGAYVPGDASSGSFASVNLIDGQTVIAKATTSVGGTPLTKLTDPFHGISSYVTSTNNSSSFTVELDFNDNLPHRTTFYLADVGNRGRMETVEVLDVTGTTLLNRQEIVNFSKGQYLTFDFNESVRIRFTDTSAKANTTPILSGIFFDAPPGQTVSFNGVDSATRGNWRRAGYGSIAQYIAGLSGTIQEFSDSISFATITDLSSTPGSVIVYKPKVTSKSGLQYPGTSEKDHIIASLEAAVTMQIDINLTDNRTHRVAAYFLDTLARGRNQKVELLNADGTQVLSSHTLTRFSKGKYLVWDIHGHVQLRITTLGLNTAVLSGLMFD